MRKAYFSVLGPSSWDSYCFAYLPPPLPMLALFIFPIYACRIFRRKENHAFCHRHFSDQLISALPLWSAPSLMYLLFPSLMLSLVARPCSTRSTKLPLLLPPSALQLRQRHSVWEAGNWLFCSGPTFVLLVLPDSGILVPVSAATKGLGSLMSPIYIDVWGWTLLRPMVALGAVCMSEVLQRQCNACSWG